MSYRKMKTVSMEVRIAICPPIVILSKISKSKCIISYSMITILKMPNLNLTVKYPKNMRSKTLMIKCKKDQQNQSNHHILLDLKNHFWMKIKNLWRLWGQWIVGVVCLKWINSQKIKGSIWNSKPEESRDNLKNNNLNRGERKNSLKT